MSEELSLREIRLQKLAQMRALGHDPFAVEEFKRDGTAKEILSWFEGKDEESLKAKTVSFAGRVVSYRDMGKAAFAHLSDGDGKIQIYCRKDDLESPQPLPYLRNEDEGGAGEGVSGWALYQLLDIGDHVGVEGYLFLTRTGEPSIHVTRLVPLSKCLETLPIGKEKDGEQWYGLSDVEQRYRHRHLDLIANHDARKALIDRSKIVSAVRRYFDGAGYLEVETPLLQVVAGGAAARPFTTHYNAYEMDVKLRISLELYLKRLICGDIPAVYEIGRVFRNEGVSNRHNPEFTLLEFYEAYTNLEGMMRRVEECFAFVAKEVYGDTIVQYPDPTLVRKTFGTPYPVNFGQTCLYSQPFVFQNIIAPTSFEIDAIEINELIDVNGNRVSFDPCSVLQVARTQDFVTIVVQSETIARGMPSEHYSVPLPAGTYLAYPIIRSTNDDLPPTDKWRRTDFSKPWKRVDLLTEIAAQSGLDKSDLSDLAAAKRAIVVKGVVDRAHQLGGHIDLKKEDNLGGLIEKLLEIFVEPTLQEPTFVVGYPIETSPLAKKDPTNPRMTRRFEGYIFGREICNAFSEINDPIDQRERFEQQAREISKGDEEAHPFDEEFIHALESGMPPTGGCGIGMERLAMVFTGSEHIREIMFFPMMKPTSSASDE
jgi:lysyl-tRNA synthetase class II